MNILKRFYQMTIGYKLFLWEHHIYCQKKHIKEKMKLFNELSKDKTCEKHKLVYMPIDFCSTSCPKCREEKQTVGIT